MKKDWEIGGFLEVREGVLHIDGVSAVKLAQKFETPLYVFSAPRIAHNIERLKRAEAEIDVPLKVCYAAKANSNMAVLRTVLENGSDLEVNSGGELFKALKIGFKPRQIIFNGTSKTFGELSDAINADIYAIQTDSLYEIDLTRRVAESLGKRARVSLRIVPEIETATLAGLKTAMNSSKFGMTTADALDAFRKYAPNDEFLEICGIHLHIGSQTPDAENYASALEFLWSELVKIYQTTGHKLSHLNLGGGFPVNYLRDAAQAEEFPEAERRMFSSDYEPAKAISRAWSVVKNIAEKSAAPELLHNIELLIEPGRSVIADAGLMLTSVCNKKQRFVRAADSAEQNAQTWLLTDAGYSLLLSMETYKWYYHLISAERADENHNTQYKLAGPLCDGGDVYFDIEGHGRLPEFRLLPEKTEVGELLALLNCGAYSVAQMFQYNGRPLPAIVLTKKDGAPELARRRETYDDLINQDNW